jgi:acyl-CoA dehydrogenase
MNLTEPHAGSDLGVLRPAPSAATTAPTAFRPEDLHHLGRARRRDNIIHLVLARLPDAPAGTRGISLFLVPKFLVNADGSLGARNDLFCPFAGAQARHPRLADLHDDLWRRQIRRRKGAIGWLIGEENKGLACMFTMMNNARLAVGMQGVAIAEAAYAEGDRLCQGAHAGQGAGLDRRRHEPDHRTSRCRPHAADDEGADAGRPRHRLYLRPRDRHGAPRAGRRQHWQERAALLTPIAKAFATDIGVDVASLGIQVHGGMGFIEETGAARYLRDARIAPIYEGTNGIQAIDLVTRKLPLSGGAAVRALISELTAIAADVGRSNLDGFGTTAKRLDVAIADLPRRPIGCWRNWQKAGPQMHSPGRRPISVCSGWC